MARLSRIARDASPRSLRTSTTPADAIAMSVPWPIAMPQSAFASAGASFTPSPTITTVRRVVSPK